MKLRLRAIKYNVDFRKSEVTNYQDFRRHKDFPGELRANEAYLFVSMSEDQLIWFLNLETLDGIKKQVSIFDTRKWRILGGSWNPAMLQDYARAVGIDLVGIKSFEEQYKANREAKRRQSSAALAEAA